MSGAASVFRTDSRDAAVLGAGLLYGAVASACLGLAVRSGSPAAYLAGALVLGFGVCWGSNTVSHIHLHAPLFQHRGANRLMTLYLTVLLGIPQSWWKRRHLWHHAGEPPAMRATLRRSDLTEIAAILGAWAALAAVSPAALLLVYLPGWALGLALCSLQGHYEHAGSAAGVDYHGRLYNWLWFNDGHHQHHHRRPGAHWSTLVPVVGGAISTYPPLLRWLAQGDSFQAIALDALERWTMGLRPVRWFMVTTHRRSFRALFARPDLGLPSIRRVCIVGGGLFPRTALALRPLLPDAEITIIDGSARNLALARAALAGADFANPPRLRAITYAPDLHIACDLLIVPLAFRGDRETLYRNPPAPVVIVHDWLWRARGRCGRRVSLLLLKRLNLTMGACGPCSAQPAPPTRDPAALRPRSGTCGDRARIFADETHDQATRGPRPASGWQDRAVVAAAVPASLRRSETS